LKSESEAAVAETYYALKELTIEGHVIPKGQNLPAGVPAERIQAGLRNASVARRREPEAAVPPALVAAPPKPARPGKGASAAKAE
jgi:hypothetical protein